MKKFKQFPLLFLLILFSCRTMQEEIPNGQNPALPPVENAPTASSAETKDEQESIRLQALRILSAMPLDEQIGQLFILAMRHTASGQPALELDTYLQNYLDRYKPGGIILFSINFENPGQTRKLIADLQAYSPAPLFITTDEEGGKVSRLGSQKDMEVLSLPPAGELGLLGDPYLVEQASSVLAMDLRDLGFNMDMAPVADITRNRPPDVIGNRSFGTDPELAGEMVAASVRGFQKNNVSSVLKHFPGHGFVNGDTHSGMVEAKGDILDFENIDFVPFIKGIAQGVDFIMTAHIQARALTGSDEPASLSRKIQTEILREQLGFKGLVITDAMDMGAISRFWSPGEAALKAFSAGADMILMPGNIPEAQKAIKTACLEGTISKERLEDSLIRIISTKIRRGLFEERPVFIDRIPTELKEENHRNLLDSLNLTVN